MKFNFKQFLNSNKEFPILTALAAGLYPFLHYFNSNLHIANSWYQFFVMLILCFGLPLLLVGLSHVLFKHKFLARFNKQRLTILNLSVFFVLIGYFIFDFKKKTTVIVILGACLLGYFIYKHLKKIIVLQFILALMNAITLVPLLSFALQQNNEDWSKVSEELMNTKLEIKPNIFVIQPDGYVNISELQHPPYDFENASFYSYLDAEGFTNYRNFRSNYFSTLTSNASMFAMRHHEYSNTYRRGHKTFNANKVIVGTENNVLQILKTNQYATFLLTDNSYFTIDRVPLEYDYHNIPKSSISFTKSKVIKTNIKADLEVILDTLKSGSNFFFIEKITPSHIVRNPSKSKGIDGERNAYIERLKEANDWLTSLISEINEFDNDALIIIVADHGGFVGLNNTLESVQKPLTPEEIKSVFSAMLAIKWPKQLQDSHLKIQSSVNLFRTVFYALSDNDSFIESLEPNSSFIPFYENGLANYYECINDNGDVILYGNRN